MTDEIECDAAFLCSSKERPAGAGWNFSAIACIDTPVDEGGVLRLY